MFDIYNLFNASPVLSIVSRYGPAWQQPTTILGGRLFKFGVQYDF
jgi:outer membrane receptor protein involved in Fe transport